MRRLDDSPTSRNTPLTWTVADLSAFYTDNRVALRNYANRILKDVHRAEEVVQDALVKVLLASPELESREIALAYIKTTIRNLCLDIFREQGRSPKLVLIENFDSDEELVTRDDLDLAELVSAADDAAIVRNALSLLSPAERAALVMWELEGRSTEEIARELGVRHSTVRHTLSRARRSLRKILTEIVVDEERGLTAMDLLSNSYKKVVDVAKENARSALSLILVFFAFLGFTSLNNNDVGNFPSASSSNATKNTPISQASEASGSAKKNQQSISSSSSEPSSKNGAGDRVEFVKASVESLPGLDKNGVPTGFNVVDSSKAIGSLYVSQRQVVATEDSLDSTQIVKTDAGAVNIFITQTLSVRASGLEYAPIVAYSKSGNWVPLATTVGAIDLTRLMDGNYLVSAKILVDAEVDSVIVVPSSAGGRDLKVAPKQVVVRMLLDSTKTQVLAENVYVIERGVKQ